ncbi:hypothetical protein [Pseudomonas sp. nanlin1]|uniref:hypothetical protein n=1 Tax=Pseudomonas sp. nanlin1 TaxID=3040605 RepID=UPI00388F9687
MKTPLAILMTKNQLSHLSEIFVSFETKKIQGCSVVYKNQSLMKTKSLEDILDEYSFIVISDNDDADRQGRVKNFMAERYGGDGILKNGGGGRCGFDGEWQLKGLGPNELVDSNAEKTHSDGNLSLTTALYESIWAEILHLVLPYGAVRSVAVLDTGRKFEFGGCSVARGLLVREPVVRLAHFIRATYFKERNLNKLGEDATRVKATIQKLANFLPNDTILTKTSTTENLRNGFFGLATRYAKQFATARAKHIIHYNVSASNVSIDGQWLDLSGTRIFTNLINGDRIDIDRFNAEYLPVLDSFQSLCYYLVKYNVLDSQESSKILNLTLSQFVKVYDMEVSIQHVAQAGFPLWMLRKLTDSPEFEAFSNHLKKIFENYSFVVNEINLGKIWHGYERQVTRLYRDLLLNKTGSLAPLDFSWLRADVPPHEVQSSYDRLFDLSAYYANKKNISRKNFARSLAINMIRLNRSSNVLHGLESRIVKATSENPAKRVEIFESLLEEVIFSAELNLTNESEQSIPFWLDSNTRISFCPASGMYELQNKHKYTLSAQSLKKLGKENISINSALLFYGDIWSILDEK